MLWLVRHGESEANAGGITSDYAAIGLTQRGRSQAMAVAEACHQRPSRVILSPYLRAHQTAEPLLTRYPNVAVEEASVQEFTYLAADRCVNLDAAAGRRPLVNAYWSRRDPHWCDGAGAESYAQLRERAEALLGRAAAWPGVSVVVTHDLAVLLYNPNGTRVSGFGTGGKLNVDIGGAFDLGWGVAVDSAGRIVLGGTTTVGGGRSPPQPRQRRAGQDVWRRRHRHLRVMSPTDFIGVGYVYNAQDPETYPFRSGRI